MADSILLDGLSLPADLIWSDEFQWSSVERAAERTLTGALIIEEAVKQGGRPITLEAKDPGAGYIWLSRATVVALKAKAATPDWSGTLTLVDDRVFTVAFREEGVIADPVWHFAPHEDTDPYTLTVKLQTVT